MHPWTTRKRKVLRRLEQSGALPVLRRYAAVVLTEFAVGGGGGQLDFRGRIVKWGGGVAAHLHAIDATPARRRGAPVKHVAMMEAELDDVITDSDESYYSGHSEDECTIDPTARRRPSRTCGGRRSRRSS